MLFGKFNEIINIRLDGFNTSLHGRNGIRLSKQSYALTSFSTKFPIGKSGGTAAMHTLQIATEDKNFIGRKLRNVIR